MNYLMYRNSNSNSSESSYDLRVTSFFSLSDPPPSYEFDNIDRHRTGSRIGPSLFNIFYFFLSFFCLDLFTLL